MATKVTFVSGLTCTLAQRLRSSGTETSLIADTTDDAADWTVIATQEGFVKWNTGANSEWDSFTGVTVGSTTNGVTRITFTGVTRGVKKSGTTLSDNDSANKKDHPAGSTLGKVVLHSYHINKFAQTNKSNTFSDTNTFTNTNTFSSTSLATLNLQRVTTVQRDGLLGVTEGTLVKNDTTGQLNAYLGGSWVALDIGSSTVNAGETVAGIVEKATDAEVAVATELGGTGAYLFTTPKQLYGTGTAGATLARNDFVYIKASDSKLYKTDQNVSSVAESWNCIGVVVIGGNANDTVVFQRLDGEFTYSSGHGFTIGATLYLGSTGAITATRPSMNNKDIVPMIIGTATSTTKVAFRPQRLQRRIFNRNGSATSTYTVTVGFPISHAVAQSSFTSTTSGNYLGASGYFDNIASEQNNTYSTGKIIEDLADSIITNVRSFVASVDGSNNLVMTMTTTGTPRANCQIVLNIFEAL